MPSHEDIWYALANTVVVLPPRRRLETFGNTTINYHLIAEKMDSVDEIRIREGRIHAEKPAVLTPAYFERVMLEGFGPDAQDYLDWLRQNFSDLTFLKYGFSFSKLENRESTVHEKLDSVVGRIKTIVEEKGEPLSAVIKGVDEGWEICLLKFITDTIRQSTSSHLKDFNQRKLLENVEGIPRIVREEIERDFITAGTDGAKIKRLAEKLRHYGVFENYEDRFYELVRRLSG